MRYQTGSGPLVPHPFRLCEKSSCQPGCKDISDKAKEVFLWLRHPSAFSFTTDIACRLRIHLRQLGLCWGPCSLSEQCFVLADTSDSIVTLFQTHLPWPSCCQSAWHLATSQQRLDQTINICQ